MEWLNCKVVMLPSNEKSPLILGTNGKLYSSKFDSPNIEHLKGTTFQHLYFISDEKIKECDWAYNEKLGVFQILSENEPTFYDRKIVATTDNKIGIKPFTSFPEPSDLFIERYIKEYNKDKQIKSVMISADYPRCGGDLVLLRGDGEEGEGMDEPFYCRCQSCGEENFYDEKGANKGCKIILKPELVVNTDEKNHIIIRDYLKTSWNRNEVISLLRSCLEATGKEIRAEMKNIPISPYIEFSGDDFDEWVEKNV